MHTYGGLPAALTVLAVLVLAAVLALFYAVIGGWFWTWMRTASGYGALVFAALWTLAEMARGTWFTGFGWGAVGYAHTAGPFEIFAPWVGVYGVGFLAVWASAAVALLPRLRRAHIIVTCAVFVGLWTLPPRVEWSESNGVLSVSLLQGNIPQDEKFQPGSGVPLALAWYGGQLAGSSSSLVVAPETAIPLLPQDLDPGYWAAVQAPFLKGRQAALVGAPMGNYKEGYTNAVLGLSPLHAQPWRYDKHHLVPFGEFIPPFFRWFTTLMHIPLGDFNRGDLGQASFAWEGQRLAPNICYEDLFGEELGARFVDAASAPTIFVNVSNLAWFGDSVAIDQHLQISRMRALEFQRPFVRATNTGATVIMDHRGQVIASLPRYTRGVLQGTVEGRTGITPFAWWVSRWGLWPLWCVCAGIALISWLRQRKGAIK